MHIFYIFSIFSHFPPELLCSARKEIKCDLYLTKSNPFFSAAALFSFRRALPAGLDRVRALGTLPPGDDVIKVRARQGLRFLPHLHLLRWLGAAVDLGVQDWPHEGGEGVQVLHNYKIMRWFFPTNNIYVDFSIACRYKTQIFAPFISWRNI